MKLLINTADQVEGNCARLLWLAMWKAVAEENTDFAPDYLFGFSHALMLSGVITSDEWHEVQASLGAMRASCSDVRLKEFAVNNLRHLNRVKREQK